MAWSLLGSRALPGCKGPWRVPVWRQPWGAARRPTNPGSRPRASGATTLPPSEGENKQAAKPVVKDEVINKQIIGFSMTDSLYGYLLEHTREPEVLRELREETAEFSPVGARMQVPPEQGAFLGLLVELMGVRRAIEVGVFTGYSAVATALALPEDGTLVALDRDAKAMAFAEGFFERAGVRSKIDVRVGPALDALEELLASDGPGSYDFAFIDADKRAYGAYYEACLKLVRPGGLIVVDNVLWYGKICDPEVNDKATLALREFNDAVHKDPRVSVSTLTVGDGLTLCRVL